MKDHNSRQRILAERAKKEAEKKKRMQNPTGKGSYALRQKRREERENAERRQERKDNQPTRFEYGGNQAPVFRRPSFSSSWGSAF